MKYDAESFITKVDSEIERLKQKNRNVYYGMSIDFERNSDLTEVRNYYTKHGYTFESKRCRRGLFDIVVRF